MQYIPGEVLSKLLFREMSCSRWGKIVILSSLLIVFTAAALVFTVDPHYRYRMPSFYELVYYKPYATAPRLLKSFDYDTLFMGSSMTRNFYLSDIDRTLGGKSLKLSAAGATPADLKKFLDIARKAKGEKLKRVFYSLETYALNKTAPCYSEFDYLYREDFKEEYRYLFSRQSYSSIYYLLKRKLRPKGKRQFQTDPDKMFSTEYPGMKFGWLPIMKEAAQNELIHNTQTPANPPAFERSLKEYLLPMVKENPGIRFYFYLAPSHIYTYCQSEQFREADDLIKQRTRVMKELIKFPNVKLYDYQADRSIVCTPGFFSDIRHFGSEGARMILKKLSCNERQLRNETEISANEKELRSLIKEQMPVYFADLKKYKERKK